jgi:hypothetical protein
MDIRVEVYYEGCDQCENMLSVGRGQPWEALLIL